MLDKTLNLMDRTFSDFLQSTINENQFIKQLGSCMMALPLEGSKKHFEVSIVNQKRSEPFFGFRIFALPQEMDNFANMAINKTLTYNELCRKWRDITNWYMEIDAQVFDRDEINLNPKELTAMVLHEVGHVIYSGTPVSYFYNAYADAKSKMHAADKASMKVLYSLYMIPLSIACMQRFWTTDRNRLSFEFAADGYLKDFGYTDSLYTALNKIIIAHGSVNSPEFQSRAKVRAEIDWCNVNAVDLEARKKNLKDGLFQKSIKTSSPFFKGVCVRVLNKMGIKLRERYTGAVVECAIENVEAGMFATYEAFYEISAYTNLYNCYISSKSTNEIAMEGKSRTPKMPDQLEIDRIAIEIDRISNHHDRIYVLDLIYHIQEEIQTYRDYIEYSSSKVARYSPILDRMDKELASFRTRVLEKHNFRNEYKFFVKYPEGYEG